MNNELIKLKGMEIMEVDFNGDSIMVVKFKDTGKIYVGVGWITQSLGFTKGQHDNEVKKIQKDVVLLKGASNLTLPTKGGNQKAWGIELDFLPLWLAKINITTDMQINHPEVMEKLVEYQLKAKDTLAQAFLGKQKDWCLQREVGKIDRKRMTSSIQTYILDAKFYTYSNYTDMVYRILFDMTAKQIRETRNIEKKSDLTRDYLTEDELKIVDEAETIVTALTALGFKFDYIKDQLQRKYSTIKLLN
jgi:hypothetical protein